MIFNEAGFFGYDGCNWFGGRFTAQNDSIFPADVAQTERGCNNRTFQVDHLARPFRIFITRSELHILAESTLLKFRSGFTESIESSPLPRDWVLHGSNDPEFGDIQAQQLIPTLSFDQDRGFRISWYCVPENLLECNEISGIFGIGTDGIQFYVSGWKGQNLGNDFMERILNASSYKVETDPSKPDALTLYNSSSKTDYQFSKVNGPKEDFEEL